MGKKRKCRAGENGGGAYFFFVRAFSIPRARLSRSLEQASATDFLGDTSPPVDGTNEVSLAAAFRNSRQNRQNTGARI